eukprot:scpid75111/ scgid17192/ 
MASLATKARGSINRVPTQIFRVAVRCQSNGGSDDFLNTPSDSPFSNYGQAPPPPPPPAQQGNFGQPAISGFGAPGAATGFQQPAPGGFGGHMPPPPPPAFGAAQGGGFGAPQGGFGAPQGGFGGQPQGGFGGPPQGGFGGPPQGGFGGGFGGQAPGFPQQNFRRPRENAPIPTKEPFGLMLLRVGGMREKELMDLFQTQNPTRVQMLSDSQAHIFFENREDLVAALAMNGKEEVSFIRVVTSLRLHRMTEIGEAGPFRAHLRNLPPNSALSDLLEIFKDFNPLDGVILQNNVSLSRYAFMEFPTKEMLLKVLDLTNSHEIKGIVVNPASQRMA